MAEKPALTKKSKKSNNAVKQKTNGRGKRESNPSLGARLYGNTRKLNHRRRSKNCPGRLKDWWLKEPQKKIPQNLIN
jgi:hypothetical protein